MPAVETIPVSANDLAWWAEEAHGREGADLWVVEGENGKPVLMAVEEGKPPVGIPLFKVSVERPKVRIERPSEISLKWGRKEVELIKKYPGLDALFWTSSSVEKFLVPYYYAQRLFNEKEMEEFRRACNAGRVGAVGHTQPSHNVRISRPIDNYVYEDLSKGVLADDGWSNLADLLK